MGITYPSGHATDTVGFTTPERAESLRDPACTDPKRVYINLDSPQSMVEDHKKNESESESENNSVWRAIERLQKRVRELEGEIEALQRGNNTGFRHENDGGWFD